MTDPGFNLDDAIRAVGGKPPSDGGGVDEAVDALVEDLQVPTAFPRGPIAEVMNRLPDVRWDRFTEAPGQHLKVFGWLPQDCERCDGTGWLGEADDDCHDCRGSGYDRRADFVLLEFELSATGQLGVGFTTSSPSKSDEYATVLYGPQADAHNDCRRVEDDPALSADVGEVIRR